MYKLELIKGLSYRGVLSATKAEPYVNTDSKEEANLAVATGYFKLIQADTPEPQPDNKSSNAPESTQPEGAPKGNAEQGSEPDYNAISTMTKTELTEFANKNGISLEGCIKVAEMREAISIALGGSPAMIDLQKE